MKLYIYNVKRMDPNFSWEEESGVETQVYVAFCIRLHPTTVEEGGIILNELCVRRDDEDDIEGFSKMKVQETPKAKREDFQKFLRSRALSSRYSTDLQENRYVSLY